MYSLASASVLAIQLTRHPRGALVADVVDRVLALTPDEIATLSRYGGKRAPFLEQLAEPDGLLAVLEMLQREHPEGAVEAALDAVVAAWLDTADLALAWEQELSPLPVTLPEAGWTEAVRDLLEDVVRRTPAQWRRVVQAHAARRGRLWWSTTMHEACLAAHQAKRVRDIARAQLATARVLHLTLGPDDPELHAKAMTVTAAVQGLCTSDLIDTARLREPWLAGT